MQFAHRTAVSVFPGRAGLEVEGVVVERAGLHSSDVPQIVPKPGAGVFRGVVSVPVSEDESGGRSGAIDACFGPVAVCCGVSNGEFLGRRSVRVSAVICCGDCEGRKGRACEHKRSHRRGDDLIVGTSSFLPHISLLSHETLKS